jgi:hypothetical protein
MNTVQEGSIRILCLSMANRVRSTSWLVFASHRLITHQHIQICQREVILRRREHGQKDCAHHHKGNSAQHPRSDVLWMVAAFLFCF